MSARREASRRPAPARRARVAIAVALLAGASSLPAIAVFLQTREIVAAFSAAADPVGDFDRRLAPLAAALEGHPVAGYFPPPSEIDEGSPARRRRFMAQYSLAPTILLDDSTPSLIVADCTETPNCRERIRDAGLEMERDFGAGLLLLRKAAR